LEKGTGKKALKQKKEGILIKCIQELEGILGRALKRVNWGLRPLNYLSNYQWDGVRWPVF
jgi:hypothetical protein